MKIYLSRNKYFSAKILAPTAILVVVILFLLIENLIQIKKSQLQNSLVQEATSIENSLLERFNSTFFVIEKMGEEISIKPNDKANIKRIIEKYKSDTSLDQIFSWTIFSWADQNSQLIVDEEYGIMQNPINLASRDYIPESILKPNQLVLGIPVFGSTSKKWMIPGGVSIEDKNHQFLGTITIGFEIDNLTKVIQSSLKNENITAELIHNNLIITKVSKSFIEVFSQEKLYKPIGKEEFLDKQVTLTRQLSNYPYKLVLTYDKKAVSALLWEIIYSRLLEILTALLLVSAMIIIIYKSEKLKRAKIASLVQREVQINHAKRDFMLRVGHELRNFVSAIIGLSDIIKDDLKNNETLSSANLKNELGHLDHINDISAELMSFITDLVDLNQSEDGKFEVHRSNAEINFEDMIERSIRILRSKIKNKNIKITPKFDDNLNKVTNLDVRRIKQILVSIIGNAITHSANNSRIDISVKNLTKGSIEILIKDCGIGMSASEISKVLEKYDFNNYDSTKSDSIELKLPIVKFLVEKQNGTLLIESNKNYGTSVTIIF